MIIDKTNKHIVLDKFKKDQELTKEEREFLCLGEYRLNHVQCTKCNDIVRSHYRGDVKSCKCGSVTVDGGTWHLKRFDKNGRQLGEDFYIERSIKYSSAINQQQPSRPYKRREYSQ